MRIIHRGNLNFAAPTSLPPPSQVGQVKSNIAWPNTVEFDPTRNDKAASAPLFLMSRALMSYIVLPQLTNRVAYFDK